MTIKNVTKKVKTDYELWYKCIEFLELCSNNETKLSPTLKNLLATGLSIEQDEPFVGKPFRKVIELIVEQKKLKQEEYAFPYYAIATYKQNLIKSGYLTKGGKLHPAIAKMRDAYRADAASGIKAISVIFKLCIC